MLSRTRLCGLLGLKVVQKSVKKNVVDISAKE